MYSLQKYNIIQCGYNVKCRPDIPRTLYEKLGMKKNTTTIIQKNKQYVQDCYAKRNVTGDLRIIALLCQYALVKLMQTMNK